MIGNKIKKLRFQKNISQEELAQALGYKSRSSIHNIEQGNVDIPLSKVGEFAKFFSVTPSYLMGWEDDTTSTTDAILVEMPESVLVPVYGTIAAGEPIEALENVEEHIDIPAEWLKRGKKIIGLKVKGDSMYPKYFEGDIVILHCNSDYNSGDDCAVYVNGYEATIKTIKRFEDGSVELIPVNTSYPPKKYAPGDYSVLGKVIEMRRRF